MADLGIVVRSGEQEGTVVVAVVDRLHHILVLH